MVLVMININYNLQDNKTNLCLHLRCFTAWCPKRLLSVYFSPNSIRDIIRTEQCLPLHNWSNSHLELPDRFPIDTKISRHPNLTIWQLNSSFIGKLYFVIQLSSQTIKLQHSSCWLGRQQTLDTDVWCDLWCVAAAQLRLVRVLTLRYKHNQ